MEKVKPLFHFKSDDNVWTYISVDEDHEDSALETVKTFNVSIDQPLGRFQPKVLTTYGEKFNAK